MLYIYQYSMWSLVRDFSKHDEIFHLEKKEKTECVQWFIDQSSFIWRSFRFAAVRKAAKFEFVDP